jgi:hypothetical protein
MFFGIKSKYETMGVQARYFDPTWYFIFYVGAMVVKQAKIHVGWLKNYQFCQAYLCIATLMSCWSRKFVLNDLYQC